MKIADCLPTGKENAITGATLVRMMKLKDLRDLTQMIERARKDGAPICASTGAGNAGYYLADGPAELEAYIKSLSRRLHHVGQTRRHLVATLRKMEAL